MKNSTTVTVYLVKDKLSGMYVGSYFDSIAEYYYLTNTLNDLLSEGVKFNLNNANIYMEEASEEFSRDEILIDLEIVKTELSIGIPLELEL